jgi:phospholipid transport system substrate-binding protein
MHGGVLRRVAAGLIVGAALAAAPVVAMEKSEKESAFIELLADQAIAALSDQSISLEARETRFRQLLRDGFAMRKIGRFVVGRYWKSMTPDQQGEYQALFSSWVLKSYSAQLGGYSGQKFEVYGTAKAGSKDIFVRTRIVRPGGAPLRCDWRVRKFKNGYKVVDVVIEGVSMLSTQRAEFSAVLRKFGADGLIDALQTRLTKFPATSG